MRHHSTRWVGAFAFCVGAFAAGCGSGPGERAKGEQVEEATGETEDAVQTCQVYPSICNDGNECTYDRCSPYVGCQHLTYVGVKECTAPGGDTGMCYERDCCHGVRGGVCINCDDGDPCTTDSYVSGTECAHVGKSDWTSCSATDDAAVCKNGICGCHGPDTCATSDDCFFSQCATSTCVNGRCVVGSREGNMCFVEDHGTITDIGTCASCVCFPE